MMRIIITIRMKMIKTKKKGKFYHFLFKKIIIMFPIVVIQIWVEEEKVNIDMIKINIKEDIREEEVKVEVKEK